MEGPPGEDSPSAAAVTQLPTPPLSSTATATSVPTSIASSQTGASIPHYIVCLGLTTTCDESHANPAPPLVPRDRAELVELSFVVVATRAAADVVPGAPMMLHWSQLFVRPLFTPWTQFGARLSGFSPDVVNAAPHSLASAIHELDTFVQTYFVNQNKSFAFVTHGEYDLRYHLQREAKEKGLVLPSYFSVFFDIASQVRLCSEGLAYTNDEYAPPGTANPSLQTTSTVAPIIPHNMSLVSLCHQVGIQHEGRLNCGIDNAVMLAKICIAVLNASATWIPSSVAHATTPPAGYLIKKEVPFTNPTNVSSLLLEFYSSESRIVYITGISYNTTVVDIQTWLRQGQLSAGQLWMLKNNEGRPEGAGYIVFNSHADAHSCFVNLNGRAMDGRAVQVGPATEKEFDLTRPFRSPFPTVHEMQSVNTPAPDTKPGDWFCSTCQFHNFANRVLCKQCNNPQRPSSSSPFAKPAVVVAPTGMKPGDWICGGCRFQNFQSRQECMKCRGPRPGVVNGGSGGSPNPAMPVGVGSNFKPGDWMCGGCHKHNFASRTVCMQCGKPNENGAGGSVGVGGAGVVSVGGGVVGAGGGGVGAWRATDRPGDWTCPNPSCRYHNYASRFECFRCGTRKG
ncbi:zinc finger domain-containing protein [Rhizoclosmatium sp. JEL0117]|nr:zinc finger domain-containing protein [Rhizoclosmatium sp. JEL0117]